MWPGIWLGRYNALINVFFPCYFSLGSLATIILAVITVRLFVLEFIVLASVGGGSTLL